MRMYMYMYSNTAHYKCRHSLEPGEHVTVMKVMLLRSQETMSGRKEYIVMGTTKVCSEESTSLGKVGWTTQTKGSCTCTCMYRMQIVIFDVLDVIPEPGKPLTKNKLKVSCDGYVDECGLDIVVSV